jgi:hypothetical protein
MQELLGFNEHRQELLQAIWQAFLLLAEHSMTVCSMRLRDASAAVHKGTVDIQTCTLPLVP